MTQPPSASGGRFPATSKRSFTPYGTPANGPGSTPAANWASTAASSCIALSRRMRVTALIFGFVFSIYRWQPAQVARL
jgi:hypothetical protein